MSREGHAGESVYQVYGLGLRSAYPFQSPLHRASVQPDLRFALSDRPSSPLPVEARPLFSSPLRLGSGESFLKLYRTGDCDVIRFTEVVDFYAGSDRVEAVLLDPEYDYTVELHLLGTILAYWSERLGRPALHASAVSVDGRACLFLAGNRGGKTSLAAALLRGGHALLSDDLACLSEADGRFCVAPGYPQMRMWPDVAEHFLGSAEDLPLAHPGFEKRRAPVGETGFGSFCPAWQTLGGIYVPERRSPEVLREPILSRVSARDAVMQLVASSFLPRLTEAAGFQAERFRFFARLARAVPVYRLVYPEGLDLLPGVVEPVLSSLGVSS
ncbi:MAG: hypothetical protein ACE5HP_12680 [Gemmatimonadota bacterium]